jgi:hypothetical protein
MIAAVTSTSWSCRAAATSSVLATTATPVSAVSLSSIVAAIFSTMAAATSAISGAGAVSSQATNGPCIGICRSARYDGCVAVKLIGGGTSRRPSVSGRSVVVVMRSGDDARCGRTSPSRSLCNRRIGGNIVVSGKRSFIGPQC